MSEINDSVHFFPPTKYLILQYNICNKKLFIVMFIKWERLVKVIEKTWSWFKSEKIQQGFESRHQDLSLILTKLFRMISDKLDQILLFRHPVEQMF